MGRKKCRHSLLIFAKPQSSEGWASECLNGIRLVYRGGGERVGGERGGKGGKGRIWREGEEEERDGRRRQR